MPSLDPSSASTARSGCGISPITFPFALTIPAMPRIALKESVTLYEDRRKRLSYLDSSTLIITGRLREVGQALPPTCSALEERQRRLAGWHKAVQAVIDFYAPR